VAVVEASVVGTIEGEAAGSMRTVLVDVAVRPVWSVARELGQVEAGVNSVV